jgi:hypothetical protein
LDSIPSKAKNVSCVYLQLRYIKNKCLQLRSSKTRSITTNGVLG